VKTCSYPGILPYPASNKKEEDLAKELAFGDTVAFAVVENYNMQKMNNT
jgi:hypothetical protein